MKKHLAILAAMALFASSSMVAQAAISVTGLHNTGEGLGPVDNNYVLTTAVPVVPAGTKPVIYTDPNANTYPNAWAPNLSDAKWIGPARFSGDELGDMFPIDDAADDQWQGTFDYTLNFTISGDAAGLAGLVISGKWATDNNATIWLNGYQTAFSLSDGFKPLVDFVLTNSSTSRPDGAFILNAVNELTFRVVNSELPPSEYGKGHINPTGLLVSNIHATPEPATLLIWGALASLGCAAAWKKRTV